MFLLTPALSTRLAELKAFTEDPANLYTPEEVNWIPGNRPEFVVLLGTTRAVFSHTKSVADEAIFRHLSMSVLDQNKWPWPAAVWTVATLLGFTGTEQHEDGLVYRPAGDWLLNVNKADSCITVVQLFKNLEPGSGLIL